MSAVLHQGRVRWGILGCGDVTEKKSGPAFQRAEGSELVAVMRRTPHLAEDYARRHGVPRWYASARALVEDPGVDAVYVASPPGAHLELALLAAAAGKPAYVEKPMARSHAECRRMVDAFAAAGLPLFVAYYRRALPRFVRVRALLAEGRLGRVQSLSYRYARSRPASDGWRLDPAHSGGGLLLDLGSHALDLFDWLLGPLLDVTGHASRRDPRPGLVEDLVSLTFRTEGGVLGSARWDFAGPGPHEDLVEIGGTAGTLRFAVFGDAPLHLQTPAGEESFAGANPDPIQGPLVQSVVDALRGKGTCRSTGETAARTSRVMDEALAAFYGGRDDAFWARG
jgi:1,5-anhydro-D-fructose reductase (1,5-anhydro-D-mannitol-forming)